MSFIMLKRWTLLLGLSLISATGLMLEVTLSNILGVILQYHYVFLAISIALFGIGIGAFIAQRFNNNNLIQPAILLSISIFLLWVFFWQIKIPLLFLYIVSVSICFMFMGIIFARIFRMSADIISYAYGLDLLGSAIGALMGMFLLKAMGGFNAMALIVLLPVLATILFTIVSEPIRWRRSVPFILSALSLASLWLGLINPVDLDLRGMKNAPPEKTMLHLLNEPSSSAQIERTYWDDFARVDVVGTESADRKMIFINGGAGSLMFRFNGDVNTIAHFRDTLQYAPFDVIKPKKVLIIGPGGGVDILNAILAGSDDITAVEISEGTIKAMNEYADFNGNLYKHPNVKVVLGDGRDFVRSTNEKFDLIVLNLVFTEVANVSSNALTENYIFTSDAFKDYFQSLTDTGSVAVVAHNDVEGMRTLFTGLSVLSEEMPVSEALEHSLMVMEATQDINMRTTLVMVGKQILLNNSSINKLQTQINNGTLLPFYVPGDFEQLMEPLKNDKVALEDFIKDMEYNIQPVDDNKPFFFNFEYGLPSTLKQLLFWLALLTLLIVSVAYVVGIAPANRKNSRLPAAMAVYFIMLGLAFMMIEAPLIQQFILYLYNPSTATAIILCALLAGGGMGSFLSGRLHNRNYWMNMAVITGLVGALAVIYSIFLPLISHWMLPLPFMGRLLISLLVVLPLGIFMGMPFPTGINGASKNNTGYVPLLYAINGIASVWGSVMAVIISILWGFNASFLIGGIIYIATMVICYIKGH